MKIRLWGWHLDLRNKLMIQELETLKIVKMDLYRVDSK